MTQLPEKITAWGAFGPLSVTGQWSANTYTRDDAVVYIRADLLDALTAERDALRAENERLREAKKTAANIAIQGYVEKTDRFAEGVRVGISRMAAALAGDTP